MTARAAKFLLLLLACVCTLAAARESRADYYKYTDGSGAVCITNRLEDVPAKYRAGMKVIREETLARQDQEKAAQKIIEVPAPPPAEQPAVPGSQPEPAAEASPEPGSRPEPVARPEAASRFDRLAADYHWFKPLVIIGGILAVFIVVIKLADLLPSPHLARLLYIVFFLGTFTFAYKTYADHMSSSYVSVKQKILTMFEKANEREGLSAENRHAPE